MGVETEVLAGSLTVARASSGQQIESQVNQKWHLYYKKNSADAYEMLGQLVERALMASSNPIHKLKDIRVELSQVRSNQPDCKWAADEKSTITVTLAVSLPYHKLLSQRRGGKGNRGIIIKLKASDPSVERL